MKTLLLTFAIIIGSFATLSAQVSIVKLSGEVKIRQGLQEEWKGAGVGILLEDIDTILTGERGEVVLALRDGSQFTLGANALLDIGDLRTIGEKELFLYLTKQKVNRLEKRDGTQRIKLSPVSVVHGLDNDEEQQSSTENSMRVGEPAKNGIRALYHQGYYPNTIFKLDRLMKDGWAFNDCGEFQFYLGKSFQEMNRNGQAIEAFRSVIDLGENASCGSSQWVKVSQQAVESIRENQE